MTTSDLVLALISTFGALVFGSLANLWLQDRRRASDPARCRASFLNSARTGDLHWVNGLIALYTTVWFMVNAFTAFSSVLPDFVIERVQIAMWGMTFLYPALIMHIHFAEYAALKPAGHSDAGWKWTMRLTYLAGLLTSGILVGEALLGGITESLGRWIGISMMLLFTGTAVYCVLISRKMRKPGETTEEKTMRSWHVVLWVFVFVSFPLLIFGGPGALHEALSILTRSFPLLFVFVGLFLMARFTFFDVFVKRGMFALLVLLYLVGYFFAVANLSLPGDSVTRVWLYALTSLPVALALPWLYRKLETWLDRAWLGRSFTPQSAVEYFLSGVQMATSENELVCHAEDRLSAVFQAPTEILLSDRNGHRIPEPVIEVPLHSDGRRSGFIRMGKRENNRPFFGADVALLSSLADVFAHLLENVRLQAKKQEQEKRQKELEVHASRSELKALRAQINPHFLFNALNAIAGLIHGSPDKAEETVEQLAEVFRYTLRGSDKEWASLEDEMDFVRAYLDVEKARFGDRLETSIEMDDSIRDVRFPVMMVQTLVENAVKHGVASVRGVGRIRIRARRCDSYLRVEVVDNGPGFSEENNRGREGSRYGLKNIRERLCGYFGDAASLNLERDEAAGLTIASICVPEGESARLENRGGDA